MRLNAKSRDLSGTPTATAALAVVAHPDDESFGLGAILSALSTGGAAVRVLCLTHGEASTLGDSVDLAEVRALELRRAAAVSASKRWFCWCNRTFASSPGGITPPLVIS
jgi:LmbE family N-acetylglucosaminyl deacetylase